MTFKTVCSETSTHDHYSVDACVVSCIDQRFSDAQKKYQEEQGWRSVDPITVAGAAKGLTGDYDDPVVQHYLWQIAASIKLHQAKLIVLEVHENCGAYGGVITEGDVAESVMAEELRKAKKNLEKYLDEQDGDEFKNISIKLVSVCHDSVKELT